jgi:very-short-patch-repair endonuclease
MRSMVEGNMLSPIRTTVKKARKLRRQMTLPEVLLWQALRLRPDGVKFRRQHPAGPYILDLYCESALTGIEVDGMAHDMGDNPARDERRDAWLSEQGIAMIRIPAREVLASVDDVVRYLVARCQPLHHPVAPDGPPPLQGGI